jgi:hypothetical protein
MGNVQQEDRQPKQSNQNGYSGQINLNSYLDLMRENSDLKVNANYWKKSLDDSLALIKMLEEEIDDLEQELEEMQEDEEESVSGTSSIQDTLSNLIQVHGGTIINNLIKGKGEVKNEEIPAEQFEQEIPMGAEVEEDDSFEEFEEDDSFEEDEEERPNAYMNGITGNIVTMEALIKELRKHDTELFKHLYKLLLIAQNKPDVFKSIISSLENF